MFTLDVHGGASSYAFTQMVRPDFATRLGWSLKDWQSDLDLQYALKNKDPNGGAAFTASVSTGPVYKLGHHLVFHPYVEYQNLSYGPLYNKGLGGGLSTTINFNRIYLNGRFAALYGLNGTVGYHLLTAGNDFIFFGKAGYRLTRDSSIYAYLTQQRYVSAGNSLTYQGVGLGLRYKWA